MKTLLATVFTLVVVFNSYSQKLAPTAKAIQQIERKADSVNAVLNNSFTKYQSRVDSFNNAASIEMYQRANQVTNDHNTHYGTVFTVSTVILGIFALFIGWNYYQLTEHHKKALTDLRTESTNVLNDQKAVATNALKEQKEATLMLLKEQKEQYDNEYKVLKEDYQNAVAGFSNFVETYRLTLDTITKNAEEKLQAIDNAGVDGGDAVRTTIEPQDKNEREKQELRKLIDDFRKLEAQIFKQGGLDKNLLSKVEIIREPRSGFSSGFSSGFASPKHGVKALRCSNPECQQMIYFDSSKPIGGIPANSLATIKCPHCDTINEIPPSIWGLGNVND